VLIAFGAPLPQPTEWQHTGNQIDAAFIVARLDIIFVQNGFHNISSFMLIESRLGATMLSAQNIYSR